MNKKIFPPIWSTQNFDKYNLDSRRRKILAIVVNDSLAYATGLETIDSDKLFMKMKRFLLIRWKCK